MACQGGTPNCFQGDMMASSAAQLLQFQEGAAHNRTGTGFVGAGRPWAGPVMKYCLATDIDPKVKHLWEVAMAQTTRAMPCMTFQDVGNWYDLPFGACLDNTAVYVQSRKGMGCVSFVGQMTGPVNNKFPNQYLNLEPPGCANLGIVLHELGHALGMAHEQSRPDRDHYVTINWQSVPAAEINNFAVEQGGYTNQYYDYSSLMHYGNKDFSTDGQPTITTAGGHHDAEIGQRIGFSQYDANQLEAMYKVVDSSCKAGNIEGTKGCKDTASWCASLSSCSSQEHMSKCCGCGGGTEFRCWSGSTCPKVKTGAGKLPVQSHKTCVVDRTAVYGGHYACVVQNSCSYNLKIECPEAPNTFWTFAAYSGDKLPPTTAQGTLWTSVCRAGCTVSKSA